MADNKINGLLKNNMAAEAISAKNRILSSEMSLDEVAQEFESLFVQQMLKSARAAKLADGVFSSEAQETYQSLLDQEYSKTLAKNHSFGIAEALVRQFDKHVNGIK